MGGRCAKFVQGRGIIEGKLTLTILIKANVQVSVTFTLIIR